MNKLNSVTIVGSSSGKNAGDAALLSGIMDSIDSACGRRVLYEIPTYKPKYVWHNYENKTRPISMEPWWATVGMFGVPTFNSLRRSKLTLIYDAMLFDRNLWNPLTNYMSTMWAFLKHAKKQGNVLGFYNVGAGPVTTTWGKRMLSELAELADFITVRDQDSYKLLTELGANQDKMLITADAAITVKPCTEAKIKEIFASLDLDLSAEILGINVNSYLNTWAGLDQQAMTADQFATAYAEALNQFLAAKNVPVLFVVTQPNDLVITRKVMDRVKPEFKKELFVNIGYNHYDIKGVLAKLSLLFAMRLHANILATSACVPAIALAFQKKVTSYYNLLGLGQNCISFEGFSTEKLLNHLNYGWDNRSKIKEQLNSKIPELAEAAVKTAQIVRAIDRGEDYLQVLRELKNK